MTWQLQRNQIWRDETLVCRTAKYSTRLSLFVLSDDFEDLRFVKVILYLEDIWKKIKIKKKSDSDFFGNTGFEYPINQKALKYFCISVCVRAKFLFEISTKIELMIEVKIELRIYCYSTFGLVP